MGPSLPLPQPLDRLSIAGSHQQLEAPDPLQGQDAAVREKGDGVVEGSSRAFASKPAKPGTTGWTADRFAVEASVVGIGGLPVAVGTDRQVRHRGVGPAVGNGAADRIAGTAVTAADERIPESTLLRIVELQPAAPAWSPIGPQPWGQPARPDGPPPIESFALADPHRSWSRDGRPWLDPGGLKAVELGRGGQGAGQQRLKVFQHPPRPYQLQLHPIDPVLHPSPQAEAGPQAEHHRPESDALQGAPADQPQTDQLLLILHSPPGRSRAWRRASRLSPLRAEMATLQALGAT